MEQQPQQQPQQQERIATACTSRRSSRKERHCLSHGGKTPPRHCLTQSSPPALRRSLAVVRTWPVRGRCSTGVRASHRCRRWWTGLRSVPPLERVPDRALVQQQCGVVERVVSQPAGAWRIALAQLQWPAAAFDPAVPCLDHVLGVVNHLGVRRQQHRHELPVLEHVADCPFGRFHRVGPRDS